MRSLLLVFALLPVLGLGVLAARPQPPTATLAFATYPTIPPGEWRTSFSVAADNAVYIAATWHRLTGAHTAYYQIYSPDGELYQVLHRAFRGPGTTWVDLPLAGTPVGRLLGSWQVRVLLDADPTIRAHASFALTP